MDWHVLLRKEGYTKEAKGICKAVKLTLMSFVEHTCDHTFVQMYGLPRIKR